MSRSSLCRIPSEMLPSSFQSTTEKELSSAAISPETEYLVSLCPVTYHLLSRLYHRPADYDLLKGLKEGHFFTLYYPFCALPEIKDGLGAMLLDLGKPAERLAPLLEELRAEYRLLFSCFHQAAAPPVESFYPSPSPSKFTQQMTALLVSEKYAKAGMPDLGRGTWPADHLCQEMEFMARLSQQSANALELNDLGFLNDRLLFQENFLEEHLLKWIPRFTDQVRLAATTDFYRGLACFTLAFLRFHLALLQNLSFQLNVDSWRSD